MTNTLIVKGVLALIFGGLTVNAQRLERRLFFYQRSSGRGVSDVVAGNQLRDLQSGTFRTGWTSIEFAGGDQMVFYDRKSGTGVYTNGQADGSFTDKTVVRWGDGWTHVVLRNSFVLLYNSAIGMANISFSGQPELTPQGMAKAWTHIVSTSAGLLFYNSATGAAAIGDLKTEGQRAVYHETRGYGPGALASGWTQIVPTDGGVLFYRGSDGHAVVVELDASGNLRDRPGTAGNMAPGWSNIVYFDGHLLFYNQATGAGVLGHLAKAGDGPGQLPGTFRDDAVLNGLAAGWTHIVPYPYGLLPASTAPASLPPVGIGKRLNGNARPGSLIQETPHQVQCRQYAESAVNDFNAMSTHRGCGVAASPRWNPNLESHRQWCLSVPENQVQSERKARTDHLMKCGARATY